MPVSGQQLGAMLGGEFPLAHRAAGQRGVGQSLRLAFQARPLGLGGGMLLARRVLARRRLLAPCPQPLQLFLQRGALRHALRQRPPLRLHTAPLLRRLGLLALRGAQVAGRPLGLRQRPLQVGLPRHEGRQLGHARLGLGHPLQRLGQACQAFHRTGAPLGDAGVFLTQAVALGALRLQRVQARLLASIGRMPLARASDDVARLLRLGHRLARRLAHGAPPLDGGAGPLPASLGGAHRRLRLVQRRQGLRGGVEVLTQRQAALHERLYRIA